MNNFFKKLNQAYVVIGILVFVYIMHDLDWSSFGMLFHSIKIWPIILANILLLPLIIIKSVRWKRILDFQHITYSYWNAFLMYGTGLLVGYITPGRVGEFMKTGYLLNNNHPGGKSLFNSLLDRIFDLLFLSAFFLVFFRWLPESIHINYIYLIFVIATTGLIGLLILGFAYRLSATTKKVMIDLWESWRSFSFNQGLEIMLITAISWLVYFIIIYLLAYALGLTDKVAFIYLSFASAVAGLVVMLPISIFGIGTRDAALVILLAPVGISKESAVAFSSLILFNYVFASLIGAYCWIKKPLLKK